MYKVKLRKNYTEVNFLFAEFDKAAAFVKTALDGFKCVGYEDDGDKRERFSAELSIEEGGDE